MQLKKKTGIVVLLDALGAKQFSIEASQSFIGTRDDVIEKIKTACSAFALDTQNNTDANMQILGKFLGFTNHATFGDTVLFEWEIDENQIEDAIISVGVWLVMFETFSLHRKLAFRGAMGYGDYLADVDSSTYLGPAVADAAEWYEISDWMGIITTPRAGILLDRFAKGKNELVIRDVFLNYPDVPIKGEKSDLIKSVNWPYLYFSPGFSSKFYGLPPLTPREAFFQDMNQFLIPKAANSKFANTKAFFEWVAESKKPPENSQASLAPQRRP